MPIKGLQNDVVLVPGARGVDLAPFFDLVLELDGVDLDYLFWILFREHTLYIHA